MALKFTLNKLFFQMITSFNCWRWRWCWSSIMVGISIRMISRTVTVGWSIHWMTRNSSKSKQRKKNNTRAITMPVVVVCVYVVPFAVCDVGFYFAKRFFLLSFTILFFFSLLISMSARCLNKRSEKKNRVCWKTRQIALVRASEQATERNENVSGVEVRRSKQTKYEKTLPLYFFPPSLFSSFSLFRFHICFSFNDQRRRRRRGEVEIDGTCREMSMCSIKVDSKQINCLPWKLWLDNLSKRFSSRLPQRNRS